MIKIFIEPPTEGYVVYGPFDGTVFDALAVVAAGGHKIDKVDTSNTVKVGETFWVCVEDNG